MTAAAAGCMRAGCEPAGSGVRVRWYGHRFNGGRPARRRWLLEEPCPLPEPSRSPSPSPYSRAARCSSRPAAPSRSPQSFPVSLSASNEPQGGVPGSSGSATVTVDPASGQVCATVTTSVTNGVAMHIHRGAPGADGPVVVPFEAKDINAGRACVAAGTAVAKAIAADPAAYYLNIHTEAAPAGALRGQLAAADAHRRRCRVGRRGESGPGRARRQHWSC